MRKLSSVLLIAMAISAVGFERESQAQAIYCENNNIEQLDPSAPAIGPWVGYNYNGVTVTDYYIPVYKDCYDQNWSPCKITWYDVYRIQTDGDANQQPIVTQGAPYDLVDGCSLPPPAPTQPAPAAPPASPPQNSPCPAGMILNSAYGICVYGD